MSARQLPIWNTLANAFCAPFRLDAASWKALGRPGLAFIIASALALVAKHMQWGDVVELLLLIPVYTTLAWFALEFQRCVLAGVNVIHWKPEIRKINKQIIIDVNGVQYAIPHL
jgi:hypothetical protein